MRNQVIEKLTDKCVDSIIDFPVPELEIKKKGFLYTKHYLKGYKSSIKVLPEQITICFFKRVNKKTVLQLKITQNLKTQNLESVGQFLSEYAEQKIKQLALLIKMESLWTREQPTQQHISTGMNFGTLGKHWSFSDSTMYHSHKKSIDNMIVPNLFYNSDTYLTQEGKQLKSEILDIDIKGNKIRAPKQDAWKLVLKHFNYDNKKLQFLRSDFLKNQEKHVADLEKDGSSTVINLDTFYATLQEQVLKSYMMVHDLEAVTRFRV